METKALMGSAEAEPRSGSQHSSDSLSDKYSSPQPPDGGCWAWLVLLGCFLVNGIIFGIINTFGILFVKLIEEMERAGIEDAKSKCGNTTVTNRINGYY